MIAIAGSLAVVMAILVLTEVLWNKGVLKGELGRKFVHITVGTFVAFWPFYMSFRAIQIIALIFLPVLIVSRRFNMLRSIHTIDRRSLGEILFAVGIGVTSLIAKSHWVFAIAILHLSLADGFAAVVGKQWGKATRYKVFGHEKSLVGTGTFWLISCCLLLVLMTTGTIRPLSLALLLTLPIASALLENVAILGFDNIFVPLLIVLVLNPLKFGA